MAPTGDDPIRRVAPPDGRGQLGLTRTPTVPCAVPLAPVPVEPRSYAVAVASPSFRQRAGKLPAGTHAELREHLREVVLDRSGADEELRCYFGICAPLTSQPSDLGLLRSEIDARLNDPLPGFGPGRFELASGPVGETLDPHLRERLIGLA